VEEVRLAAGEWWRFHGEKSDFLFFWIRWFVFEPYRRKIGLILMPSGVKMPTVLDKSTKFS